MTLTRRHFNAGWLAGGLLPWVGGCANTAQGFDAQSNVLTVPQGALQGRVDNGIHSFKRIPYAANPYVPERAYAAPQPAPSWSGLRDATRFGPMPPQPSRGAPQTMVGEPDDLCLNIWTPSMDAAAKLPVMVWIPGGAYIRVDASEPWYDGSAFARDGVVLVSINYRVGAHGFLVLPDAPSNRGILDQIAALQWVRDHIAHFGGDASRVTVFGQSAGASSVAALLGAPGGRGLFAQAALQSPAQGYLTLAQAARVTPAFAQALGVSATRDAFARIGLKTLIDASIKLDAAAADARVWSELAYTKILQPVIDGVAMRQPPAAQLAAGASKDVPILIGSNDEEFKLYLVPGGAIDRIPEPAVAGMVATLKLPPEMPAVYRVGRPNATPGEVFSAINSDYVFRNAAQAQALAHAKAGGAPTYAYQFGWRSPQFGGRLGAAHVLDVPFVFDTLRTPPALGFVGPAAPQELATRMHAAWVAFAKTGKPGWQAYDDAGRTVMRFDTVSTTVREGGERERALWSSVVY